MAKILIIDDDEQFSGMLHQLLTSAGHAVTIACDGFDGLRHFRGDPADLVITDLVMPNKEGIETIMALRRSYVRLPIIAMSGCQPEGELWLKVARLLGASCALTKPFSQTQLFEAVALALTGVPHPGAHADETLPIMTNIEEQPQRGLAETPRTQQVGVSSGVLGPRPSIGAIITA